MARLFFSGIAGAGMNPLAQLMRSWGHEVAGSDRGFDAGKQPDLRQRLVALGIHIVAQDGSGIHAGLDRVIYSTAVEQDTPEVVAARGLGLLLTPRPQLLAEVVNNGRPGVAIAGTSGKSTITGMLGWILTQTQRPASLLGGAPLVSLASPAVPAATPGSAAGVVVAEACESDGTLPLYRPQIGVVHNISRDHGEVDQVRSQFHQFAEQSQCLLVNGSCPEAASLAHRHPQAVVYGGGGPCTCPLEVIAIGPQRAHGLLRLDDDELELDLPQPGLHTIENAAAAAVVAHRLGVPSTAIGTALRCFPGVSRRFEVVGTTDSGIRIVDDYAHNGEKLRAAVRAAQAGCQRLLAIFQPHGYGPARFLRPELRTLVPGLLRPQDRWCYAEIFYAGGTVAKDISGRDLQHDLPSTLACGYAADHAQVLTWVAAEAMPGDTVLVMGARDPDLPRLARALRDIL